MTKKNYVFIDYENVQPNGVSSIKDHDFSIVIFIGKKQKSISSELAEHLQPLGTKVKYVNLNVSGPNALDFILTFYLGTIYSQDDGAYFHIISKDKGFDSLIEHLRIKGVKITRHEDLKSIHPLKLAEQKKLQNQVDKVIEHLSNTSRPRKLNRLISLIQAHLKVDSLTSDQVQEIINKLVNKGIVEISDDKITYPPS